MTERRLSVGNFFPRTALKSFTSTTTSLPSVFPLPQSPCARSDLEGRGRRGVRGEKEEEWVREERGGRRGKRKGGDGEGGGGVTRARGKM